MANRTKPSTDQKDFWFQQAYKKIPEIVRECKVVTDREIKVRLEGEAFPGPPGPFPWVTGYALGALVKNKVLKLYGYVGRRRIKGGVTNKFYCLYNTPYSAVKDIIQRKRRVSADVNTLLTGEASASFHAEDIFLEAFTDKLGFIFHKRDVSCFRGKKASGIKGKQPPNVDFVLEQNEVFFGVDVKNWIRFEYETPKEVYVKLKVAKELELVPFIVARYLSRPLTNEIIYERHGLVFEYKELILQLSVRSLSEEANQLLGYPNVAVDSLPDYMIQKIKDICNRYFAGAKA